MEKQLEVVKEYKYLGYFFTTKLSPNVALVCFASRGKAALIQICRTLNKLLYVVSDLFFKIFDCQIQPILLYASEVWGLGKSNIIETVHLYGLKRFLNVSVKTPNIMIYGDTGRYPLSVNATMRVAKYWVKILGMEENRLPKRVYRMLLQNIDYEYNWTYKLRSMLRENGLAHLWQSQTVECKASFFRRLKESLINRYSDTWVEELNRSERYATFRIFKSVFQVEPYLYYVDKKIFRETLVKFRFGENERYFQHRYDDLFVPQCQMCNEEEGDEYHLLVRCPAANDLREKYLAPHVHVSDDSNAFRQLMSAQDQETIRAVGTYLYHIQRRREVTR